MKIKNQTGTSRSGSPAIHTLTNFNDDTNNSSNGSGSGLASSSTNSQFISPSTSTQIWTRSAVRAAQQQKSNDTSLCHKHHKHHGHTHSIGKIVKPIPVRPMSSSSSSSSTHSSQFNTKSIHSNLSNLETVNNDSASNGSSNGSQSFSLIAKYFASFPATRLAKTQIFSETAPNSTNELNKSTPFLPFKKSTSTNNNSTNGDYQNQQQSSIVLRSQTALNLTNTDHLCTNFRRMIKLNEPEFRTSPFYNIRTNTSPAAQTPTGSEQIQPNVYNSSAQYQPGSNDSNDTNLQLQINQESLNQFYNSDNNDLMFNPLTNDEDTTTRLGQITMETRSTRKFLIKHHPYLQQNQSLSNFGNQTKSYNQRPSINLMKKLNSKKFDEPVNNNVDYTTPNSSSNNRSGRSSRSNNSGFNEQHDHNLLKFTDTAPMFSNQKQKTNINSIKRRKLKSLTSASALYTTELNQQKKLQTRSRTNKTFARHSTAESHHNESSNDFCDCDCFDVDNENDNENSNNDSCEQYYDEQEEDSSGYYSSYHSVDLISSSGGSCVGTHHLNSRQTKLTENGSTNTVHNADNTDLIKTNNNSSTSNNTNNQQNNNLIPQHHYHTRYLTHCLEQKQDLELQQHKDQSEDSSMSYTSINKLNILPITSVLPNVTSNSTIPTTRLRYQQQLAAQAKFNNHLECDLDLDQIEND